MQITVKTLQQKVFTIEAEPTDTVSDLKGKISEIHGHDVASQKLIYSGKILADTKEVKELGIKEKDFLVLMVSKPKATPTPAASSSTSAQTSTTPAAATPASAADASAPATTTSEPQPPNAPIISPAQAAPVDTSADATPASSGSNEGTFLSGTALQTSISNMVEMGFPLDQVTRAMRASFNNPERAVEYLMNGIPAGLEQQAATRAAAPATAPAPTATGSTAEQAAPTTQPAGQSQNLFQLAHQQQQEPRGGGGAGGAAGGALALDAASFMNDPQFQGIREAIRDNPTHAQAIVDQLSRENPQLLQALAENPEILIQYLQSLGGGEGGEGEGEGGEGEGQRVYISEDERAAIQRLQEFGFTEQQVIRAFVVCDRDVDRTANYLFEYGDAEEDDIPQLPPPGPQ